MHNDTDDPELSEVERLTEEAAKIKANLAAAKLLADQRENLLPKLKARLQRVRDRMIPWVDAENDLMAAIADIKAGRPTTYQFRRPRAKKPAEEAE